MCLVYYLPVEKIGYRFYHHVRLNFIPMKNFLQHLLKLILAGITKTTIILP